MESDSDSSLTEISSGLSSARSSVSPPPCFLPALSYPSPQSSQDHSACASSSEQGSKKRFRDSDDVPPAKKRKSVEAKPRTTVHLDLRSPPSNPQIDQTPQLDLLLKSLRKRRKIVVIAGAGISTSAGIPDFRSSNGLFNTLRSDNKLKASGKHLFDASVYQTDESTSSFHDMVRTLSDLVNDAEATPFHQMLATLASEGRLMRLYTQNVDGLDTSIPPLATSVPLSTKGPWPQTIQLHGSLKKMVCSKCNNMKDFDATLFNGPVPPSCTVCMEKDEIRTEHAGKRSHGIGRLRPRMVLYNEHNPDDEAIGTVVAADLRARPDAVIVVGTSMEIPGVKRIVREMCGVVRSRRDGVAIWINRGPPPIGKDFEDCWDLVVAGDCDRVAERANMRRWDDEGKEYKECTESEFERAKQNGGELRVVVEKKKSPSPRKNNTPAMITPAESPNFKATKLPNSIPPLKLSDGEKKPLPKSTSKNAVGTKKTESKSASKPHKRAAGTSISLKHAGTIVMGGIKTAFKITKGLPSTPKKIKTDSPTQASKYRPSPTGPEKARKLLEAIGESMRDDPVPMGLVSPNSARSNGPLSPQKLDNSILKLEKVEVLLPAIQTNLPGYDDQRLKRMSEEVVSPTGTPPKDMVGLLN